MTDRKKYLSDYMKSNYSQIRIVIRKDDPVDQEIVRYLNRKPDKSGFLKQMILQEIERERQEEQTMTVHDKRTDVYHRDFEELIELEKGVYSERDALELLDRLDTSRKTTYRLSNGIGTQDWRDFIDPKALHNGDELILTGEQHCGNKYKLIEIVHLDKYDEEDQEFMEMWTEPIGWDNY